MDSRNGIECLFLSKDEVNSQCFNIFEKIKDNNIIKNCLMEWLHPISLSGCKCLFKYKIPSDTSHWMASESLQLLGKVQIQIIFLWLV